MAKREMKEKCRHLASKVSMSLIKESHHKHLASKNKGE